MWPHYRALLLPAPGSYYSLLRGVTTPYSGELLLPTPGSYYSLLWGVTTPYSGELLLPTPGSYYSTLRGVMAPHSVFPIHVLLTFLSSEKSKRQRRYSTVQQPYH
ncbi:hypothetical protein [Williamwhitmania taraxaci]|uniref:hypothetical protein n=1 Tax=Williamwhitmania taraxaci TaxID=1640674 RepID=UPI000F7A8A34|nr:hypothetical protein [Williamwhitmania taraxaci]